MKNKRQIGTTYEKRAAQILREHGYLILERNFHSRYGEIDLICRKDRYLVFVEVKYRKTKSFGVPQEAVDTVKQRRICNTASFYLYSRHLPLDTPCRFDVVAVSAQGFEIIENAFFYCGNFGG